MFLKIYFFSSSRKFYCHTLNGFSKCFFSSAGELPVIKIPKYLEKGLGNAIYKEHKKVKKFQQKPKQKINIDPEHVNKLVISWSGDKKLFHYYGKHYNPEKLPLISKLFLKETCNGERMTFHNFADNPSVLQVNANEEKTFEMVGLCTTVVESINRLVNSGTSGKSVVPSSIQFGVIPLILNNRNVIFSAETGSGKTIAYLAPIIQMIEEHKRYVTKSSLGSPYGMVILPSRELTEQVGNVAQQLALNTNVGVATMIGGLPKNLSHSGMDLVVTTIGMVEPHLNRGVYSLRNLRHLVLDEADTLLDDTFCYEVVDFLEQLNLNSSSKLVGLSENEDDESEPPMSGTQLICSSATLPTTLDSTIGSFLNLSEEIEKVTTTSLHSLHTNIKHIFYRINRYEKDAKLMELLIENRQKRPETIIFANRTNTVNWLYNFLNENNFSCTRLTSEMSEEERFQSFRQFQNGEVDILVATDLGSRGLDTIRVRHVINFDCPHYTSDYIHRSGRTGRLGTRGTSLVSSLVSYKPDGYMLIDLERAIRLGQPIASVNANIKSQISQHRADKLNKFRRNA